MKKFVMSLMLLLSPAAFAGGIERKAVTVEGANDDYTSTGITVKTGDHVIISATGTVSTGTFAGKTNPDGHQGPCKDHDEDGALVFKIGTSGALRAGSRKLIEADHDGELKLKVRDTKYTDNKGSYSVDLIHIPAGAKAKATPLTVDVANDEWTPSTLNLEKGDLVLATATVDGGGKVQLHNAMAQATGTPAGLVCPRGRPSIKIDNDGALMMKVGTSEYVYVGDANFFLADAPGPVKFKARLDKPQGSKGTYSVSVIRFPASKVPANKAAAHEDFPGGD